jgi:hypothetical protein
LFVALLLVSLDAQGVLYHRDTLHTGDPFGVQVVLDVLGVVNLLLEARVLSLLSLLGLVDDVF